MTDEQVVVLGSTFTIPPNPEPGVRAWPYFVFADVVGLPMERLDDWIGHCADGRRTMCLVDVDGRAWVAEGEVSPAAPARTTDADVRSWAKTQRISVNAGGRVTADLRAAYETWVANYLGPWPEVFRITDLALPAGCNDDPDGQHHVGCGCENSDVFE